MKSTVIFLLLLSLFILCSTVTENVVFAYDIGWYTNDPSSEHVNNLATYASQGTTVMLPYNSFGDQTGTAAYLNEAAIRGIKVWVDMRLHVFRPSQTELQNFINKFKTYPAVKGWYIADEPEYSGPDYVTVLQYFNWIKAVDQSHPVSIAHAWTVKSNYAGPTRPYDIVLLDVYPGWGYSNNTTAEFNSLIRESYKWWRDGKNAASVPIEAVPLGFGYLPGTTTPQNGVRDMTDNEHRYHSYTAVALGYSGLIYWWDMNNSSWTQTNPVMKALVTKRFNEISQINIQMDNSQTTNTGLTSVSVAGSKLIYRYGTANNAGAIVAVNISRWDQSDNNGEVLNNVSFTLPSGARPNQIEVVGESRTIPVTNGVFSDNFNRFGVHIYKFATAAVTVPVSTPTPVVSISSIPSRTPAPSACLSGSSGNLNCDSGGLVNETDLSILLNKWAPNGPVPTPGANQYTADLNGDGKVNETDLARLLNNWKI
jgi:hypothetical protein